MKYDVVSDGESPRQAVVGHTPVGGDLGLEVALEVDIEESVINQVVHDEVLCQHAQSRVEVGWSPPVTDPDGAAGRRRCPQWSRCPCRRIPPRSWFRPRRSSRPPATTKRAVATRHELTRMAILSRRRRATFIFNAGFDPIRSDGTLPLPRSTMLPARSFGPANGIRRGRFRSLAPFAPMPPVRTGWCTSRAAPSVKKRRRNSGSVTCPGQAGKVAVPGFNRRPWDRRARWHTSRGGRASR